MKEKFRLLRYSKHITKVKGFTLIEVLIAAIILFSSIALVSQLFKYTHVEHDDAIRKFNSKITTNFGQDVIISLHDISIDLTSNKLHFPRLPDAPNVYGFNGRVKFTPFYGAVSVNTCFKIYNVSKNYAREKTLSKPDEILQFMTEKAKYYEKVSTDKYAKKVYPYLKDKRIAKLVIIPSIYILHNIGIGITFGLHSIDCRYPFDKIESIAETYVVDGKIGIDKMNIKI